MLYAIPFNYVIHIARAVFASCPHDLTGCTSDEVISVTAGENIKLNATVTHTSGGACGFKQEIKLIKLMKISGVREEQQLLLSRSYRNTGPPIGQNSDKVSLSGGTYDLNFVFTLQNAVHTDSGMYQVTVQGEDPATGAHTAAFTKTFRVTVTGKR